SPFALSAPASSIRNSDHGPVRSSTAGGPASLLTEMAVRTDGPGHCTVVGAALASGGGRDEGAPKADGAAGEPGLAITVPPISVLMSTPGAAARGGLMASDDCGWLPPVWKNASRMVAAT